MLVSPGIAPDDGEELKSCSEAQQDAGLEDGGPQGLHKGQQSGCQGRGKGRSTARGRKGPIQPELTTLG